MRKKITFPGTVKKFGTSYHIVIPKDYIEGSGWKEGQTAEVTLELYDERD